MDLGTLIEDARKAIGISGREAARRAGLSESRWRGIIRDNTAPARTVVAMALATGANPAEALTAAGNSATPEAVSAMVAEIQARAETRPDYGTPVSGLAEEIERVKTLPLPPAEKIRIANALIEMYEERAREPAE